MNSETLNVALGNEYLVIETRNQKTRIVFDISREVSTLTILDYQVERCTDFFDSDLMHQILMALRKRSIHHVLTDVLPDGLLPSCSHLGKTLHCNLQTL